MYSSINAKDFSNGFVNIDAAPADLNKAKETFEDLRVPSNLDAPQPAEKNKGVYKFEANIDFKPEYPFDIPYGFVNVKFVNKWTKWFRK